MAFKWLTNEQNFFFRRTERGLELQADVVAIADVAGVPTRVVVPAGAVIKKKLDEHSRARMMEIHLLELGATKAESREPYEGKRKFWF